MRRLLTARFEIQRITKDSAQAVSFLGLDRWDNLKPVFVKFLASGAYRPDATLRDRLMLLHGLRHPFLTGVCDAVLTRRRDLYITRPFVEGEPLTSCEGNIDLAAALVSSCAFLRSRGIVHGRLKPENAILRSDGTTVVLDAGLPAPLAQSDSARLSFVAPELIAGQPPNLDSDLYSLGALLHRLLSGRDVFEDANTELLRNKCVSAVPMALGERCSVPESIGNAVDMLLSKDPPQRRSGFNLIQTAVAVRVLPAQRVAFTGRKTELSGMLEGLRSGDRGLSVLVVEGETGAGKTRIIEHLSLIRSLEGGHLLTGRSFERDNRQFEPLLQILDERLRRRDQKIQKWIATHVGDYGRTLGCLLPDFEFPPEVKGNTDSKPSRGKLVADLVGSLVSLFDGDPTLIVALDDLHWADEGTLEVLEQLGWRAGEASVRLLLTIGRGQAGSTLRAVLSQLQNSQNARLSQVTLSELDRTAALEMAGQLVSDRGRTAWVVDHSAGNPLFIEEYAKYEQSRQLRPSRRLTDILLQEFSRYAGPEREAAQILSLFPTPIDQALVPQVLAKLPRAAEARLEKLETGGLLVRTRGRWAFRHDGIRQAIYRSVSATRRRTLHRLIRLLLETTTNEWSSIAHHADRAGDSVEALEAYRKAAGRCFEQNDYRTAIELLSSARVLALKRSAKLPLADRLMHAECLVAVGRRQDARDVLSEGISPRSLSPDLRAKVNAILSSTWVDEPAKCLHYSRAAIDAVDRGSPRYPRALLSLARAFAMCGRVTEAKAALRAAEESKQMGEQHYPDWTAARGLTQVALCEYSEAFRTFIEATTTEPAAPLFSNRAVCLEHLGKIAEACKFQEKALERSREYGSVFGELLSLSNLAAFHTKRGTLRQAAALFQTACDISASTHRYAGSKTPLPLLAADKAALMMEMGEYGSARKLITTAVRQLKNDNSSQKAIWVAIRAAELYGRTEEHRRASDALDRVMESELFHSDFFAIERALITRVRTLEDAAAHADVLQRCLGLTEVLQTLQQKCRVLLALGVTWTHLGDNPRARKCLAEAKELAHRYGYKPLSARIELTAAYAAESDDEHLALLTTANRQATKLGLPEVTAESGFRIGQVHARSGHVRKAHECFVKSLSRIDKLAATLPPSCRRRYLRRDWRAEVKTSMSKVASQVRSSRDVTTKQPQTPEDRLFRLTYQHSVRLNNVTTVEDLVSVLHDAVTAVVRANAIVFLDARGSREVHASGQPVDEALTRSIARLYKKAHDDLFVGRITHSNATDASFVWIPLKFQHHRFGGVYVSLSRSITEKQIEFLTTLAMNASATLAALLWSTELSVDQVATPRYGGIVGRSPAIEGICTQIDIAAQSGATVLIEGESGTGKELVARAIHENSSRSNGPFIAVDCGAIPETLIESEFFGSQRGSFTGATTDRVGLIESSDGGTLFLDEISNTSPPLQAKLLRVLQEREIRRLGDTKGRKVDLRLIAATNANLDQLVEQSTFRQDLLYRLKVLHIVIPPLRQRHEDIPEIARVFLARLNSAHGTRKRFHKSALRTLSEGTYRGNVRELQNVVERAYFSAVGQDVIAQVGVGEPSTLKESADIDTWFKKLTDGRESFWQSVHARYKSRDISREKVLELMDVGLRASRGSYKNLATMLHVDDREYRRFMDFLRRNNCQPDFRPYRRRSRDRGESPPLNP